MDMDKSTPRPWFTGKPYDQEEPGNGYVGIGPFEAAAHYEDTIAECWNGEHDAAANAALIVRAVNRDAAFDALVEALRVAADALQRAASVWRPGSEGRAEFTGEAEAARAALALAEAK